MKQILQDLATGATRVVEMPTPNCRRGRVLIQTRRSLVSAGTERMLVEFGRANWLEKVRKQPDKVRDVLRKASTDGLLATTAAVRSKLDEPQALGYCNAGVVVESGVPGFASGDRVVSNGRHAEFVTVPGNLCARIPDGVTDEQAAFTVIGSIALQGVRLAQPTLGECFIVTGLGLIGLLTAQILRANGCHVLGIDLDETKLEIARRFGAETVNGADPETVMAAADRFSQGRGVDGVLLTLASRDNAPVTQAARMCRQRGRIVLVGVTGLQLDRADFYQKELTFQVSCSYGPGRYDPGYEEGGIDYPVGFVRWTEQRNFEAVLELLAAGSLDVAPLVTHRFELERAPAAYELLASSSEPYLGILLEYSGESSVEERTIEIGTSQMQNGLAARAVLGVIGAGNYAGRVLIPAFHAAGATLHTLANSGGANAAHWGAKYGFSRVTTDVESATADPVNTVVVATRHDSHAMFVCKALTSGKHVWVEKPLCLTLDELRTIESAHSGESILMVGFNRRFSPLVAKVKSLLDAFDSPRAFIMTMNAGAIPPGHWTHDEEIGGGRIVGEACHYIDLMRFLAGTEIVSVSAQGMGAISDNATITLCFADGSLGSVHYLASGHRSFPKERVEVFAGGRVLQIDNFRRLNAFGWPGFNSKRLWRQDKGQVEAPAAFLKAVESGGPPPIAPAEIFEVARVTLEAAAQLRGQCTCG